MTRRASYLLSSLAALAALAAHAALAAALAVSAPARSADPLCTASYAGAAPRAGAPLRFGVDPGIAGSAGGTQLPSAPDNLAKDVTAMRALRPTNRVLVARLNRLFWSDGAGGIARFRTLVGRYTRAGLDAELQVRYHPAAGQAGNLAAWVAYVRHVVDVFGANPRVVSMTITNEVNLTFSPNTSDGAYPRARDALIKGIEAAHAEAVRRDYGQLRFGFTYVRDYSGTFNVTDYRWFNLRDSGPQPAGPPPLFYTDGLLRSDYSRKPSFSVLRGLVGRLGRHEPGARSTHPTR